MSLLLPSFLVKIKWRGEHKNCRKTPQTFQTAGRNSDVFPHCTSQHWYKRYNSVNELRFQTSAGRYIQLRWESLRRFWHTWPTDTSRKYTKQLNNYDSMSNSDHRVEIHCKKMEERNFRRTWLCNLSIIKVLEQSTHLVSSLKLLLSGGGAIALDSSAILSLITISAQFWLPELVLSFSSPLPLPQFSRYFVLFVQTAVTHLPIKVFLLEPILYKVIKCKSNHISLLL